MKKRLLHCHRCKKRKHAIKNALKAQLCLLLVFLLVYGLLGTCLDPGFFRQDLARKYALADELVTVSMHIAGAPTQPILSATPGCNSGSPYVLLTWNTTEDTDSYSVDRDSLPLVTGLVDTSYWDETVSGQTTYTYQVTANGPMGNTASNNVTISTPDCATFTPATCRIQTVGNVNVANSNSSAKVTDRTPTITGTSNIPNGIVTLTITGKTNRNATTYTNLNGYWSWTPATSLDYGRHTIWATVTDPAHLANTASDWALFDVEKKSSDDDDDDDDDDDGIDTPSPTTTTTPPTPSAPPTSPPAPENIPAPTNPPTPDFPRPTPPYEIAIQVTNPDHSVIAGDDVTADVAIIRKNSSQPDIPIVYVITDDTGHPIVTITANEPINGDKTILNKNFPTTRLLSSGRYKITATSEIDGFILTAEDYFLLQERPLITFAGGFTITLTYLLSHLGWLILLLLIIIACFLALLGLEHHATTRALIHITEDILNDRGFISRRKGVAR